MVIVLTRSHFVFPLGELLFLNQRKPYSLDDQLHNPLGVCSHIPAYFFWHTWPVPERLQTFWLPGYNNHHLSSQIPPDFLYRSCLESFWKLTLSHVRFSLNVSDPHQFAHRSWRFTLCALVTLTHYVMSSFANKIESVSICSFAHLGTIIVSSGVSCSSHSSINPPLDSLLTYYFNNSQQFTRCDSINSSC